MSCDDHVPICDMHVFQPVRPLNFELVLFRPSSKSSKVMWLVLGKDISPVICQQLYGILWHWNGLLVLCWFKNKDILLIQV